ncbi:MAG: hypothetical protein D6696_05930, partial [Acidobacteria bacterium]
MATVDRILDQRRRLVGPADERRSLAFSLFLHGLLIGLFWVLNSLSQEPPRVIEHVPLVRVVPPAALGIESPPPPPPPPPPPKAAPPPPPAVA